MLRDTAAAVAERNIVRQPHLRAAAAAAAADVAHGERGARGVRGCGVRGGERGVLLLGVRSAGERLQNAEPMRLIGKWWRGDLLPWERSSVEQMAFGTKPNHITLALFSKRYVAIPLSVSTSSLSTSERYRM